MLAPPNIGFQFASYIEIYDFAGLAILSSLFLVHPTVCPTVCDFQTFMRTKISAINNITSFSCQQSIAKLGADSDSFANRKQRLLLFVLLNRLG